MGQWKVSTLIARDSKTGKWEVLDGPRMDGRIEQNVDLKTLKTKKGKVTLKVGGKSSTKQYDLAAIQLGVVKRAKFL